MNSVDELCQDLMSIIRHQFQLLDADLKADRARLDRENALEKNELQAKIRFLEAKVAEQNALWRQSEALHRERHDGARSDSLRMNDQDISSSHPLPSHKQPAAVTSESMPSEQYEELLSRYNKLHKKHTCIVDAYSKLIEKCRDDKKNIEAWKHYIDRKHNKAIRRETGEGPKLQRGQQGAVQPGHVRVGSEVQDPVEDPSSPIDGFAQPLIGADNAVIDAEQSTQGISSSQAHAQPEVRGSAEQPSNPAGESLRQQASSEEPMVVSVRSLRRKRKPTPDRTVQIADHGSKTKRIKREILSSSPAVPLKSADMLDREGSLDLDDVGNVARKPQKLRQEESLSSRTDVHGDGAELSDISDLATTGRLIPPRFEVHRQAQSSAPSAALKDVAAPQGANAQSDTAKTCPLGAERTAARSVMSKDASGHPSMSSTDTLPMVMAPAEGQATGQGNAAILRSVDKNIRIMPPTSISSPQRPRRTRRMSVARIPEMADDGDQARMIGGDGPNTPQANLDKEGSLAASMRKPSLWKSVKNSMGPKDFEIDVQSMQPSTHPDPVDHVAQKGLQSSITLDPELETNSRLKDDVILSHSKRRMSWHDLSEDTGTSQTTPKQPASFHGTTGTFRRRIHGRKSLRDAAAEDLQLGDFKINPHFNQGLNYAFAESVRSQAQRRCLPGCVRDDCCGSKFKRFIEIGGFPQPLPPGKAQTSSESTNEQGDATVQAKSLADQYGKHRQAFERRKTPPGFWRADMPNTQELERDREVARRMEREKVGERQREAMRRGGKWLFRDE
ncbi:MAG: hypothetical protein M1825_005443 [Sarcosagium campestre]|nr:MAG: hypothetical protein M1825_005443 [Sarcosagium campestre]